MRYSVFKISKGRFNDGLICVEFFTVPVDLIFALGIVAIGVFVGLLSGMFGFGGSSISTPLLRMLLNVPPYLALGSPFPMTIVSSGIATYNYNREGKVDWKMTWKILVAMIPASILGAYLTAFISGGILMVLTAFFLLYMSLRILFGEREPGLIKNPAIVYTAGFVIGFVSGLLANGGGSLVAPILFLLGKRIKSAIGTSLAIVLFGSLPAIFVHWYLGHVDLLISLLLIVGATPTTYLGARITLAAGREKVRKGYGAFLLVFSLIFLLFELLSGNF